MISTDTAACTAAVRRLNRFCSKQIGLVQEHYLCTPFTVTESRVLYEIAQKGRSTASDVARDLTMDPEQLSRVLQSLGKRGFVESRPAASEGRSGVLRLTDAGRDAFATLDFRSQRQTTELLRTLSAHDQSRVVKAMEMIESLFGTSMAAEEPYVLRLFRVGDMGWIVHRHGVLYAEEYGWNEQFEALVAEITAAFVRNYDPPRERCWIAERRGEIIGSVFLVRGRTRLQDYACSSLNHMHAGWGWARGSWTIAFVSGAAPATRRSSCGRTAC